MTAGGALLLALLSSCVLLLLKSSKKVIRLSNGAIHFVNELINIGFNRNDLVFE